MTPDSNGRSPSESAADGGRRRRTVASESRSQVLARLNHPNIAAIYERLDDAQGATYLVLEYVPGQTLAERIGQGPLGLHEALSIAGQVAAAMAAAHEQGVVHRDLKPGNIKITPSGTAKVLDFGLAKATDAGTQSRPNATTQLGMVIGTRFPLGYLVPGVVLYEMLAGEFPFPGDTRRDGVQSILHAEPPRLRHIRRDVPRRLERLVLRMIHKDPTQRPANVRELLAELDRLGRTVDPARRQAAWRRTRPKAAAVLTAATLSSPRVSGCICGRRRSPRRPPSWFCLSKT
jgi:serine/threonine-protein kinase